VPYPTSCSPQAWASAAPLLLVRAFLGLDPHVPDRRIVAAPRLPREWGRLALTDLRLGDATVHVEAEGETVKVSGIPGGWEVITPPS
jgi:glycogen debranching enzyme